MLDRALRHGRPAGGPGPKQVRQWNKQSRADVTGAAPTFEVLCPYRFANAGFKGRMEKTYIAAKPVQSVNARDGILLPPRQIRLILGDIGNGLRPDCARGQISRGEERRCANAEQ